MDKYALSQKLREAARKQLDLDEGTYWDASVSEAQAKALLDAGYVVIHKSDLPEVTIKSELNEPTTCRVVVGGRVHFDGVDKSALLHVHRCHMEHIPNGVHVIHCPTGIHPMGWQHMPGVHKMCTVCG